MAAHQAPAIPGILQARVLEWVAISFSILSDYMYTKCSKLFENIITGFGILLLVLISGEVYSLLSHF